MFRIFNGRAPHDTMDFIALFQEEFCEITPILPGNASD